MNMIKAAALAACAGSVISASAADAKKLDKDAIVNGVHGYMPENYVVPTDPLVRERLEWFKDQKLALMMHWGIYTQLGIVESWAMCDKEAEWSRMPFLDWMDWHDGNSFRKLYFGLNKSFNPVRFDPEVWAGLAAENGFRYVIFTTKHHDGFCMFDTKYTDYKVTAPDCPFSKHPRANIAKEVFDAFRAKNLGIFAYFSKPDWHSTDYWENHGIGFETTRMPTYDVEKNPAKWAKFREFTRNQLLELVRDYGPIDALWLDGGQVQKKCGLDIDIDEIIAEARKIRPGLIAVDRTAGGACENVITPEQTVPPQPLAVPWESCITMGTGFSYRYDDEFKSERELIFLLIDVVAKGGNLALNVAPGPDGRFPVPAVRRMNAMGAWLKKNGECIYATRPTPPYRIGSQKSGWAYTQSKDGQRRYAIVMWPVRPQNARDQFVKLPNAAAVRKVTHVASGRSIAFRQEKDGLLLSFPKDLVFDQYADGFRFE